MRGVINNCARNCDAGEMGVDSTSSTHWCSLFILLLLTT